MNARETILQAIRAVQPPRPASASPVVKATVYEDRRQRFAEVLAAIGGRGLYVRGIDALNRELAGMPEYTAARNVVSLVAGAGRATVDLDGISDPHQLENVDFAILPGKLAVAENGAVWVTDEGVRHRAIYFITQHLVLVVPADAIVDNLHQAYQRLCFDRTGYGTFLAGPSKTADIEQALVIGAHGSRSLTVLLFTP